MSEEDDHTRDYVAKSRIDDLRSSIDEFLRVRQHGVGERRGGA